MLHRPRTWTDSLASTARDLSKYNFDLVGVREIRWDNGGTDLTDNYTFLYEKGNVDQHLRMEFFTRNGTISSTERAEFVSDRMPYNTSGRWCELIVLNVYATTEN
jgi:hypothetical protein